MNWSVIFAVVFTSGFAYKTRGSYLRSSWFQALTSWVRPVDVNSNKTRYWVYTRDNPSDPVELVPHDEQSTAFSYMHPDDPLVVLLHGWNDEGNNIMNKMLTEAFLEDEDVTVIVVDWSDISKRNFAFASRGVVAVGQGLASIIEWFVSRGLPYDRIHLVGYSMGAHVAGCAGKHTGGKIKRITGLDPSRSLWLDEKHRITRNDARYVEIIHTTYTIGTSTQCGHADFYPNGGSHMPGCSLPVCSHRKSYEYLAASVRLKNLIARQCYNMDEVASDTCYGPYYPMGTSNLNKSGLGIFRVNTLAEYPFVQ